MVIGPRCHGPDFVGQVNRCGPPHIERGPKPVGKELLMLCRRHFQPVKPAHRSGPEKIGIVDFETRRKWVFHHQARAHVFKRGYSQDDDTLLASLGRAVNFLTLGCEHPTGHRIAGPAGFRWDLRNAESR